MHVLFLPFPKDKKEAAKVRIIILGIGIEYTLSSTVLFFIYEYHNISKDKCYILQTLLLWLDLHHCYLLLGFYELIFTARKYRWTFSSHYFVYWVRALGQQVNLRIKLIVVIEIGLLLEI